MNLHDEVSPEVYFYVREGVVVKSVSELSKALDGMDEETFKHHVNQDRNDFSNWIHDIYQDKKLALSVKKCKTISSLKRCLEKGLKSDGKSVLKKNTQFEKRQKKLQKKLEKLQKKLEKKEAKRKKAWEKKRKKEIAKLEKEENRFKKIVSPKEKGHILKLLQSF